MPRKNTPADIPEESKAERLSALGRKYGLADVYAFGSRALEAATVVRGNQPLAQSSSSDLDIAIRPAKGTALCPRELVNLTDELEDFFGGSRVDLVLVSSCDPFLALDIIRGEVLYVEDPVDQSYYELFVLRRAGDLLPLKRDRINRILGGKSR